MKHFLMLLFTGLLLFTGSANGQRYLDLTEGMREDVSRAHYRGAKRAANEAEKEFDFALDLIDRIKYNEAPAERSMEATAIESVGKNILLPASVRQFAIDQCGKYTTNILIADSGVDPDHQAYRGDHWLPPSNYSGDPGKHWHGTHVGGTAYSMVEEVNDVHGNFRFKDCQVLGSTGGGSFANATNMELSEIEIFRDRLKNGEGVIMNKSFGATTGVIRSYEDAMRKGEEIGIVHVAAAGNTGKENPSYPAGGAHVTGVAALTTSLNRASFSNIGEYVDCAAPGVGIRGPIPGGGQADASGSSMASPLVTGCMALAYGKNGPILQGANMGIFHNYVCTDLTPEGWDKYTGFGIAYVVKMLETDPCDVPGIECGEDPEDPEDPEEPNEPGPVNVAVSDWSGYTMRWMYPGEREWRIIHVPSIRIEYASEGLSETEYDRIDKWLISYFNNRGIEVTPEMSGPDAVWWTAQFLEYVARDEFVLDVVWLVGIDEQGREFFEEGFDRAESGFLEAADEAGVRMLDL